MKRVAFLFLQLVFALAINAQSSVKYTAARIQEGTEYNPPLDMNLHQQGQQPYAETGHTALAKVEEVHVHIMAELLNGYNN